MIGQIDIRENNRQEKMLWRRKDIAKRFQKQRIVWVVEDDQDMETINDMDEGSD